MKSAARKRLRSDTYDNLGSRKDNLRFGGFSFQSQPGRSCSSGRGKKPPDVPSSEHSDQSCGERLNQLGIGRGDRVAVVLPNGPEMAVAFLGVAASATCAPLNPAYRADEFDFYLSDLNAKAVLVSGGLDSPAVASAQKRAIPVLKLSLDSGADVGDLRD